MGGTNETIVPASSTPLHLQGRGNVVDGIRIHESNGEVHFHLDRKNLKVAVPVATWSNAWDKLSTQLGEFDYIDTTNGSALEVFVFRKKKKVLVEITVKPVSVGDSYSALERFSKGK